MTVRLPNFDDVRAAAARIAPYAVKTPLLQHPALDARTGGRILLKAENLQRVGAFKFRGAYNAVSQIDRKAYPGGVVACSSGNHAQGVAAAATLCGMPSVIVMPSAATSNSGSPVPPMTATMASQLVVTNSALQFRRLQASLKKS